MLFSILSFYLHNLYIQVLNTSKQKRTAGKADTNIEVFKQLYSRLTQQAIKINRQILLIMRYLPVLFNICGMNLFNKFDGAITDCAFLILQQSISVTYSHYISNEHKAHRLYFPQPFEY